MSETLPNTLDRSDATALYVQLKNIIRDNIASS